MSVEDRYVDRHVAIWKLQNSRQFFDSLTSFNPYFKLSLARLSTQGFSLQREQPQTCTLGSAVQRRLLHALHLQHLESLFKRRPTRSSGSGTSDHYQITRNHPAREKENKNSVRYLRKGLWFVERRFHLKALMTRASIRRKTFPWKLLHGKGTWPMDVGFTLRNQPCGIRPLHSEPAVVSR